MITFCGNASFLYHFDSFEDMKTHAEQRQYLTSLWNGPGWYGTYGAYNCQGEYETELLSVDKLREMYIREIDTKMKLIADIDGLSK